MIYFVSGHRNLSEEDFMQYYARMIENIVESDIYAEFVVGDCQGGDKMAAEYIAYNTDCKLTIYHMFEKPRFRLTSLLNEIHLDESDNIYYKGGYKSDEERDTAMTKDSDFDIAFITAGRIKSGTGQNILRRHFI